MDKGKSIKNSKFFAPMMIASGALASKRHNMPKWSFLLFLMLNIERVMRIETTNNYWRAPAIH